MTADGAAGAADPGPDARDTAEPAADVGWRTDLGGGLLSAALGAAVLLHVRTFPQLPDGQPGPALFPGIVGALLVVFGLVLAVRALLTRDRAVAPGAPTARHGIVKAIAVLGFVLAYLLLAETLGFVITMAVLLFLLTWLLGVKPLVAAASAVVTTGVIVLLFRELLFVPLPVGLLG
jgi:putative tricarboxylic transport membrane protein